MLRLVRSWWRYSHRRSPRPRKGLGAIEMGFEPASTCQIWMLLLYGVSASDCSGWHCRETAMGFRTASQHGGSCFA